MGRESCIRKHRGNPTCLQPPLPWEMEGVLNPEIYQRKGLSPRTPQHYTQANRLGWGIRMLSPPMSPRPQDDPGSGITGSGIWEAARWGTAVFGIIRPGQAPRAPLEFASKLSGRKECQVVVGTIPISTTWSPGT